MNNADSRKDSERMETQRRDDLRRDEEEHSPKGDPTMTKGKMTGSSTKDPFANKVRLGRTPVPTGKMPHKTTMPVKGPAARTRAKNREDVTGATSTEEDVPSSILDTEGAKSSTPLRTVVKNDGRRESRTQSHSVKENVAPGILRDLLAQMENLTGRIKIARSVNRSDEAHSNHSRKRSDGSLISKGERNLSERREAGFAEYMAKLPEKNVPEEMPMRGHPGLYLPRTASIFNPFQNLRFSGTGDRLHPVLFIRKFTEISNFERVDEVSQVHYFAMCLTGPAATWWSSQSARSIREALEALRRKYWSTSHQLDLTHKILLGGYFPQRDGTMADYVARCSQENTFLDHPLPEKEFVTAMMGHFTNEIERELRVSLIKTVEQLIEVLDEIELSRNRAQQRTRARLRSDNRERDETRIQETGRVGQRPMIPQGPDSVEIKEYPRRSPYSPTPVRKTVMPTQRNEYVRRFTSRSLMGSEVPKRRVNFKATTKRRETSPSNETVSVTQHDSQQEPSEEKILEKPKALDKPALKKLPMRSKKPLGKPTRRQGQSIEIPTTEKGKGMSDPIGGEIRKEITIVKRSKEKDRNSADFPPLENRIHREDNTDDNCSGERVTEEALIAPLSAASSPSSSSEQRSIEEYALKIPIQKDGRIMLPIRLVHHNISWQMDALVDTGATISLIAERELDRFTELLKSKHKQVPPKGGFFRKIRVRKTNLNGPFQSKIACAYYKANLQLQIKLSKSELLVTFHTVYVVKRMTGSFILGADFLREYGANIYYYSLNTARFAIMSRTDMITDSGTSAESVEIEVETPTQQKVLDDTYVVKDNSKVDLRVTKGSIRPVEPQVNLSAQQQTVLTYLLKKYQELLDGSLGLIRGYVHKIEMKDSCPHKPKSFPVPLKYREQVREQLVEMESLGVISKQATEFISPLVVALRSNGKIRICLDARAINEKMVNEHAKPPTIDEVLALIGDRNYFSKIDINKAYWQIKLDGQSSKYTGFLFDGQTYVFERLPFGLKTSSSSFTRALGVVLDKVPHLRPNLIVYLDDILVCSHSFEDHIQHLSQLFETLHDAGIRLNKDKCQFVTPVVQFLGHELSQVTVEMTEGTKQAISVFKAPMNKKQLQSFLGLINWDRRFVPNLSELTKPLENLLKKEVKFKWTLESEVSFAQIKQAFKNADKLFLIRPNLEYGLDTDASCVGLGARLFQFDVDNPDIQFTLAYASRSLKPAELNYTTTEQEGLALAWALNKFKIILIGRRVHVSTDHRALVFLGSCANSSRRIARWMELFTLFDLKVSHVPGAVNTIADYLSRQPTMEKAEGLKQSYLSDDSVELELAAMELLPEEEGDISEWIDWIRAAQKQDPTTREQMRRRSRSCNKRLGILRKKFPDLSTDKIIIPDSVSWEFLGKVHVFLLHFGTDKVIDFVKRYFVVENLDRTARDVVASCHTCLASKYYTRPTVGDQYYDLPGETGLVTSIDLFGPLPRSYEGNKYVLVLMDLFSKHTALYPLKNQKVDTIIHTIENDYIPRRGYVPQALLTDRGGQFVTAKWKLFAGRVGTQLKKTAPYNPQANPVERVMRELGRVLRTYARDDHECWDGIIPRLETVMNHVTHSSTGYPPIALELDYHWYSPGRGVRINPEERFQLPPRLLPLHMVPFRRRIAPDPETPQSREQARYDSRISLQIAAAKRKKQADKKGTAEGFRAGQLVWRKTQKRSDALHRKIKKLFPVYEGPLRVIGSPHPNSYELQWLDGRYAGLANLRQLRPHREARLQPNFVTTLVSQSMSNSSEGKTQEEQVAVLSNDWEDSSTPSDEEYHRLAEESRTWSKLKRSQTHIDIRNYQKTAGEEISPSTSTTGEIKTEPQSTDHAILRFAPEQLRVIQDISVLIEQWTRALDQHKRRKLRRRQNQEYASDRSLSTLSSGTLSSQVQSDIREAIQTYHRAVTFYKNHYPVPLTSPPPEKSEILGFTYGRRFAEEHPQIGKMEDQDLGEIMSMEQLHEIREYWIRRRAEARTIFDKKRNELIEDVEQIRREALNLEATNGDTNRILSSSAPPTGSASKTSDRQSWEQQVVPGVLSSLGELSQEEIITSSPILPQNLATKPTFSKDSRKPTSLAELRVKVPANDGKETPGTSGTKRISRTPISWTSDSSDSDYEPPKIKDNLNVPVTTRRQRFGDPKDALARIRHPKTGRFVAVADRESIGPPGKKERPSYLPPRPEIQNKEKSTSLSATQKAIPKPKQVIEKPFERSRVLDKQTVTKSTSIADNSRTGSQNTPSEKQPKTNLADVMPPHEIPVIIKETITKKKPKIIAQEILLNDVQIVIRPKRAKRAKSV